MAKRQVSDSHKQAMAQGRAEGRVVKNYLQALEQNKPKRGRKRTPESIRKKLAEIDATIDGADPLNKLTMAQQRLDLTAELANMESDSDIGELEKDFVSVAAAYSERKGISYAAWREVGVSAAVLKAAGISR
ncbi:MAG: hypothetical protein ACR2OH_09845 [Microthrixaceae bacterium]